MKNIFVLNKKTKYLSISILLIISIEVIGRLFFFQINSKEISFISNLYNERLSIKNTIRDFLYTKEINSERYKNNQIEKILKTGIDRYKLSLSDNDLLHFEKIVGFMDDNGSRNDAEVLNTYRKIKVEFEGVTYNAKIKMHLGEPRHWKDSKKSYSLKLSNSKLINNKRKIDLIVPEDRGYFPPLLCKELSHQSGLPHPENGYCVVYINEKYNGIYLMEEEFDNNPEYFEKNKVPNDLSLRPKFKDISDLVLWDSKLEFWESSAIEINSPHDEKIISQIDMYLNGLRSMDYYTLCDLVDVEKIAAVCAINIFWGYSHDYIERNIRLLYSVDNGLIYYQPRAEDAAKNLNFTSPHYKNSERIDSFEHGMCYFYKTKYLRMFHPFLKNNKFRDIRNNYIRIFFNDLKIENRINNLHTQCLNIFPNDPFAKFNRSIISHLINDQKITLDNNAKKIKESLSLSSLFISAYKSNNKVDLSLLPDSLSRLKINNFKLFLPKGNYYLSHNNNESNFTLMNEHDYLDLTKIFDNEYLMTELDDRLLPQKNYYKFSLTGESLQDLTENDFEISVSNTFTNKLIPPHRIHLNVIDNSSNYMHLKSLTIDDFIKNHPDLKFSQNGKKLLLRSGIYEILNDLIIPKGLTLNIEKGTTLNMGVNTSIISYSPINFIGTANDPIFVKSKSDNLNFGTIAMVFDKTQNVFLNHLKISGGSDKFANGTFFNGALSIHNANINMDSCVIRNCIADDGINFKRSNVTIRNSEFINNNSDHIDLDFCNANLDSNKFVNFDGDNIGDGIDLSGSSVIIKNNEIRYSGDKGISVGEKSSVLITGNSVEDNQIGIAVKDSSRALISENIFDSNEINISCYVKKGIFNGGVAYLYSNLNLTTESIKLDDLSDYYNLSAIDIKIFEPKKIGIDQFVENLLSSINLNFDNN